VTLTRSAVGLLLASAIDCAGRPPRPEESLRIVEPRLEAPLAETYPAPSLPDDPVKLAVFERINRDRTEAGVPAVAWDEAAGRVADAFCLQQVREKTRGHFLMDGLPPYARTGFAGVFGLQAENSVSWLTTGPRFRESASELALSGHEQMMGEKPPDDGHRQTILDPGATHVGVGFALEGGRFQMAQEFLTRYLASLRLSRREPWRTALFVEGQARAPHRIQFVTISREPLPRPLSREQASGRTRYSYPPGELALVPEGIRGLRVVGTATLDRLRLRSNREFNFAYALDRPGLWTFVFYTVGREGDQALPGGSAVVWIE
jgi:hypothetical protein